MALRAPRVLSQEPAEKTRPPASQEGGFHEGGEEGSLDAGPRAILPRRVEGREKREEYKSKERAHNVQVAGLRLSSWGLRAQRLVSDSQMQQYQEKLTEGGHRRQKVFSTGTKTSISWGTVNLAGIWLRISGRSIQAVGEFKCKGDRCSV
jgi:hypothetical protein